MRCDGEGVLRETVRCDYASSILGFFGSLHYLTNDLFYVMMSCDLFDTFAFSICYLVNYD